MRSKIKNRLDKFVKNSPQNITTKFQVIWIKNVGGDRFLISKIANGSKIAF